MSLTVFENHNLDFKVILDQDEAQAGWRAY